ncbi:hypothetical protein Btru_019940, partial [Bulinus truncatus]
ATFVQAYNTFWENVNSSVLADGTRLNLTTLNSTAASNTAPTFNMYQSFNNCTCYWAHTSSCYNLTCLCVAGWTGDFCDVEVDECSQVPSPCGDNMTCVNTQGSYRCECRSGTRLNTSGECEAIPAANCQYSYCTHTAIPAANYQYSYCTHTAIPAANCQYSYCTHTAIPEANCQYSYCTHTAIPEANCQYSYCTHTAIPEANCQYSYCSHTAIPAANCQYSYCTHTAIPEANCQYSYCTHTAIPAANCQYSYCTHTAIPAANYQYSYCTHTAIPAANCQYSYCTHTAIPEANCQYSYCTHTAIPEANCQYSYCTHTAIPEANCQYSYCTHTAIPAANCQYSYCTHTAIPAANCQYSYCTHTSIPAANCQYSYCTHTAIPAANCQYSYCTHTAIPAANCQYSYCTHTAIPEANCHYSYCTHTAIPAANCQYSGDIIMVLDSSGSIGSGNFQQLLSFVNSFVTSVLQSPNDIRFGLIEFDEVPIKRFDLKSYNTLPQYQTAILGMAYLGGSTQTGKALRLIIADQMFSEQAGGRVTAPDIVITITDGMSSNPNDTIEAAKSIKGSGVKALSVGITGNVDMTELNVLASRPEYVTLVNDFNSFYSALIPLLNNTCQAIKEAVEQHPGVCNGANFTNGEANLPFPGDCTKVIQCYYNPDSKTTLAVVRRCSPGEFWSPEKQDCASSWTVNCTYDKCKRESRMNSFWDCSLLEQDCVVTYPMPGTRRGYFRCKNGRSYPECCPLKSEYAKCFGCQKNPAAIETCGPEKSCGDTTGVCRKLPIWKNQKIYLEKALFSYQVPCLYGDFDIVDCQCVKKTLIDKFQNKSNCPLIYKTNTSSECSDERLVLPAASHDRQSTKSQTTIQFSLRLLSPHFEVTTSPTSTEKGSYGLKLWGDVDTINVAISGRSCMDLSQTYVPWKNATGDLEVSILLRDGLMTLGVTQNKYTIVSTVEAKQSSKYMMFQHDQLLKAKSDVKETCIVSKVQVFDCLQRFTSIYS